MTVFVYEDVCAIGAGGDQVSPPAPSLLAEGRAMLDAVTADARAIPGVDVVTAATAADFDRLAGAADWTLVIAPECGGRLEELCRRVVAARGRLLGPSPDAVRLTADKLMLCDHWRRRRFDASVLVLDSEPTSPERKRRPNSAVAYAPGWSSTSFDEGQGWSSKAPRRAGSQATRLDRLPPAEPWPGPMIAQEYVAGFPQAWPV